MNLRANLTEGEIIREVGNHVLETILIGSYEGSLGPEDSFLHKGILDSTGVLELVQFLESQYAFKCLDHEITPENLDSLQGIAIYVRRKLGLEPIGP